MRGPEDFIGQQFFDANFKSLPGQRLRNTAVAHFVHFRSLQLWVRGAIWLWNVIFVSEFKILRFSPSPPFVLLIHKVFKKDGVKSIFTTFILPRLLLGKRKNKWQFFVTFLEKGRWKAANFELTEKADSDCKLFFCGEKEGLESEFVLLRAHAAAVFSDVYFFENSFKEQPPSTQRPNKQTIILRKCGVCSRLSAKFDQPTLRVDWSTLPLVGLSDYFRAL